MIELLLLISALCFLVGFGIASWRIARRRRALALALLRNAGSRGMYGLDLIEASGGTLSRVTVYIVLSRLQDQGLVRRVTDEVDESGRIPRSRYFLVEES